MAMASFTLLSGPKSPFLKSNSITPFHVHPNPNPRFPSRSPIFASSSSSWEREEALWLREEQRWLREEQRWLREESRWRSERDSLLAEISALRHRIEAMEHRGPPEIAAMTKPSPPLLAEEAEVKEMILEGDRIKVSEERTPPLLAEESDLKEMILEGDKIRVSEKRRTLRMGAEGEEVRAMQEALMRLGFYSGEDDMEFSSFSSGTERAVKTWQASLGTPDDGIMTSELLEMLFRGGSLEEIANTEDDTISATKVGGTNGAVSSSLTEVTEVQQTVIKESGYEEPLESDRMVFLLGENRWEEPSRLLSKNKPSGGSKDRSTIKCLTCRGEGRLMCTECDGSGEPNIEPQFLEWVGEDTKCAYCEGLGYTICDVCEGKKTTAKT